MTLLQIAQHADDLDRATDFYTMLLDRLEGPVDVVTAPLVIFTHDDDTLGPAGYEEWQAFVRDTEGTTVDIVAFQKE